MRKRCFFRCFKVIAVTVLMFSILPCQSLAINTSATASILMDVDSRRILHAQNESKKMLIASTTKIMTALVAIENGKLTDVITVKKEAALVEGSSMYLREGDQLTLEELLYGLLLCSGNDAAVVIADAVGGSQEAFVAMMNRRAKELGMSGTSFANPNGLDHEEHYSTASDMAKLACAAVNNETLIRIASTKSVTIQGRTMTNHNKLLSSMEGCIGLKTGYTRAAGRTLVSCAEKNGQRLVAVTLQDGNDWADHQALYGFGFSAYPAKIAIQKGDSPIEVSVRGGMDTLIPLVAADTVTWPAAKEEVLSVRYDVPAFLSAPLSAGMKVGEAIILLDGQEVDRTDLLCGKDVLPRLAESIRWEKR